MTIGRETQRMPRIGVPPGFLLAAVLLVAAALVWMHALQGHQSGRAVIVTHVVSAPAGHAAPTPGIKVDSESGGGAASQSHQDLSGGPAYGAAGSEAARDDCHHHHQHQHSGQFCGSAAVAGGPGPAQPPLRGSLGSGFRHPVPTILATAALDAGGGSGCGPPSLTLLSISRT